MSRYWQAPPGTGQCSVGPIALQLTKSGKKGCQKGVGTISQADILLARGCVRDGFAA